MRRARASRSPPRFTQDSRPRPARKAPDRSFSDQDRSGTAQPRRTAQSAWEAEWNGRLEERWRIVVPTSASSSGSSTLTTQPDDSILASGTKRGYLFEATYGAKTSEFIWFATARPVIPEVTGWRYFAANHEGVTYYTTSGPFRLNGEDCTIPAGVQPVGR